MTNGFAIRPLGPLGHAAGTAMILYPAPDGRQRLRIYRRVAPIHLKRLAHFLGGRGVPMMRVGVEAKRQARGDVLSEPATAASEDNMKIGVDLMLWTGCYDRKCLPLIDKVAKMGFDGVEFPIFAPQAVDVRATRKALEGHGLGATVCTVIVGGNLISPSAKERRQALDHLHSVLEVSKEIGADCVAGPLYSPVGRLVGRGRNEQEWKFALEGLRELAEAAESIDINVAIEPLNRFETYFLNTMADTVELCREIDSPNVGVHYDTFHANIEEADPVAALKKIGRKRLFHVHTCENDRGIPGSGHVPWDATMKALEDMGYDRWLTIESFVPAIPEMRGRPASGVRWRGAGMSWRRRGLSSCAITPRTQRNRRIPSAGRKIHHVEFGSTDQTNAD